jgi:hypothetical protein
VAVYPFLMRERWRVLSTKSEYPGSRVTERFRRHLELGLSIKGGVKIGGRPGSQTLLENGRMLARTNIYPWITHLFCLNAWPINIVLNIQACRRNPATNTSSRPRSCGTKLIPRTSCFGTPPTEERTGLIDDRKNEAWAKQDAALGNLVGGLCFFIMRGRVHINWQGRP